MIILGLNAFHADSSAALLRDGNLVAAAEEERFRRLKHWAGFPSEAIAFCLREAGVQLSDVDHIAYNQDSSRERSAKNFALISLSSKARTCWQKLRNRGTRVGLPVLFDRAFPGENMRAQFHAVEHHLAHLFSAYLCFTIRAGGRCLDRWFWRFLQCCLGYGSRKRDIATGTSLFPAFTWAILSSDNAVSWIPPLRR